MIFSLAGITFTLAWITFILVVMTFTLAWITFIIAMMIFTLAGIIFILVAMVFSYFPRPAKALSASPIKLTTGAPLCRMVPSSSSETVP